MAAFGLPVLFAVFVWWFSTGIILYLVGLPRPTFRWTMVGASGALAAALFGLARTGAEVSIAGSYLAFTSAVLVWAWQEIGFLLGFVTGPRRTRCPPGATGWRRAAYALQTILDHECALIFLALAVAAVTWDKPNQVGFWTFMILWAMRQSAKLNLFLGVRNLSEEFLPAHLRYLESYFTRKLMNPLLPVSVVAGVVAATWMWQRALAEGAGTGAATGSALLATLLCAAILEHLFMVMPLPATALWRWGLSSRKATPAHPGSDGARRLQACREDRR